MKNQLKQRSFKARKPIKEFARIGRVQVFRLNTLEHLIKNLSL